jgi:hypothetical protein
VKELGQEQLDDNWFNYQFFNVDGKVPSLNDALTNSESGFNM